MCACVHVCVISELAIKVCSKKIIVFNNRLSLPIQENWHSVLALDC